MTQSAITAAQQASSINRSLIWGAAWAAAALLAWLFVDPLLVKHVGWGAPWWAYALLSMRLLAGIAHMLANDLAARSARRGAKPGVRQVWEDTESGDESAHTSPLLR